MESTTFYYSKLRAWIGTAFFAIAVIILIALTVASGLDGPLTVFTGTITMVIFTAFCIFLKKYSIPAVHNKPALVLDREKAQYFTEDKTVYWREVERVSLWASTRMTYVRLTTKGTADDVMIGTRFIEGTDEAIFDAVQQYFNDSH